MTGLRILLAGDVTASGMPAHRACLPRMRRRRGRECPYNLVRSVGREPESR